MHRKYQYSKPSSDQISWIRDPEERAVEWLGRVRKAEEKVWKWQTIEQFRQDPDQWNGYCESKEEAAGEMHMTRNMGAWGG